jgi:defect-in-organelle-trafficking protein DotC
MNVNKKNLSLRKLVSEIGSTLGCSLVFGMVAVSFSSPVSAEPVGTTQITLEQLQDVANTRVAPEKMVGETDLRMRAIQEAAQSYGARAALQQTSNTIRNVLEQNAPLWDKAWNFIPMMLVDEQTTEKDPEMRPRIVVPPVLMYSILNTRQDAPDVFHIVNETYIMKEQTHFSSIAPSWRTYLLRDESKKPILPPHNSLLPKTDEEREQFKKAVSDGWNAGVKQAYAIHEADLAKLTRDFVGMSLYHELVEQHKISLPFIASSNQPITGDTNTLNVNDITLRITVLPAFQRNVSKWTPTNR